MWQTLKQILKNVQGTTCKNLMITRRGKTVAHWINFPFTNWLLLINKSMCSSCKVVKVLVKWLWTGPQENVEKLWRKMRWKLDLPIYLYNCGCSYCSCMFYFYILCTYVIGIRVFNIFHECLLLNILFSNFSYLPRCYLLLPHYTYKEVEDK